MIKVNFLDSRGTTTKEIHFFIRKKKYYINTVHNKGISCKLNFKQSILCENVY